MIQVIVDSTNDYTLIEYTDSLYERDFPDYFYYPYEYKSREIKPQKSKYQKLIQKFEKVFFTIIPILTKPIINNDSEVPEWMNVV